MPDGPPADRSDILATRIAYDTVARGYAELLANALAQSPFDRAVLAAFADLIRDDGGGPVADLGCGPGRIAAHLAGLGVDVVGLDLSPQMVAVARERYPQLPFVIASMAALPLADHSTAGLVSWYSMIHTPPRWRPELMAEFARVLAPSGQLVLAFQVGDECVHIEQVYGHEVSLNAYRLPVARIEAELVAVGFAVTARLVRAAVAPERTPQAYPFATMSR